MRNQQPVHCKETVSGQFSLAGTDLSVPSETQVGNMP